MQAALLEKDSEFTVREEKVLDYILAILFFAVFVLGLVYALKNNITREDVVGGLLMLALIPSLIAFAKAKSKRIYIRINKTGIYQDEQLVAGWDKMIKAYITQKQVTGQWQDSFLLVLEYRKEVIVSGFRRRIPLTNTQNKSEEEIIEAIRFFWHLYKREQGITSLPKR